jgi:hypothetical protein
MDKSRWITLVDKMRLVKKIGVIQEETSKKLCNLLITLFDY